LVASPPGVIVKGDIWLANRGGPPIDLTRCDLHTLQDVRGGRIAYIFQDPLSALNPVLRAGDQVAETLVRHRGLGWGAARKEAIALLDSVRLPQAAEKARAYPHELSGGQRQRVMIAMALANKPDLIIADEPTTALDVTTQKRVLELLDELRRENDAALMFISHDFGVIADLCDRVQVMYAGEIVEEGAASELFARPSHPYTERLLSCIPDLTHGEEITAIPGLPPAVDRLPKGCNFAPRCHWATDECRQAPIDLRLLAGSHAARCLFAEKVGRYTAAEREAGDD
jgi:peptide/nickel transport system permease protein